MRSQFSVDDFLATTIDPGGKPLDTKVAFVPEGEYHAQITGLTARRLDAKDDQPERTLVEITWTILDDTVKASMGLDDPRARQTLWLDTEPNGSFIIAKNKNTQTGALLDAFGLNNGKKWSWGQLRYNEARVKVRLPRNEDQAIFSDVVAVARL